MRWPSGPLEIARRGLRPTWTRLLVVLVAAAAVAQQQGGPRNGTFEGQPSITLSNDKLQVTVMVEGSAISNVVMTDDAEKMNPLWNPMRLAREAGRQAQFNGTLGHFVCVDGFGRPSAEERAAGLPQHGEAHITKFDIIMGKDGATSSVSLSGKLPIVQEAFTRTFHIVDGESVMYVDSRLENLMGFDRPVNWAEHATVAAPFLQPGITTMALSGSRSQDRDYLTNGTGRGGAPNAAGGRGGSGPAATQPATQRRLVSGQDFTWPMAPGLDGKPIDMSAVPDNPHYIDHAATLLDPARQLEWVAAFNSSKRTVYGYVFKREEYPWVQHWGNYPAETQVVRGMEFATQPYDIPRREVIANGPMFGTPTYRWLPAKSTIESHFLLFYTRVPDGFRKVDDVRLENGKIVIEDRGAQRRVTLAASRGL
ncbi:MAG TPA: hypothetical protein VNY05_12925 [Candidatus Acidoferrales bacterium]|nr:hypothetical protein [Candidatus Acidoferrales bacterium]